MVFSVLMYLLLALLYVCPSKATTAATALDVVPFISTAAFSGLVTRAPKAPPAEALLAAHRGFKRQESSDDVSGDYNSGIPDYPCNGFYTPVYINDRFVGCCDSADYCEGSAMGEYIATDESTVPLEDTAVGEATATGEAIATNGESAAGQATATDEIGYSTAYPTTTSSPSSDEYDSTYYGDTKSNHTVPIVVGVVGGVLIVMIIAYLALAWRKRDWLWAFRWVPSFSVAKDSSSHSKDSNAAQVTLEEHEPKNNRPNASTIDGTASPHPSTVDSMHRQSGSSWN